jgi:hypothetical protein
MQQKQAIGVYPMTNRGGVDGVKSHQIRRNALRLGWSRWHKFAAYLQGF